MPIVTKSESLRLAEEAHALVQAQPERARALAEEALQLATSTGDAEGRVAALHARGFARYALGEPGALASVRAAVQLGERDGFVERSAKARRTLAVYLAYAGKPAAAIREIEAARTRLTGIERARTEVHRIAVLQLVGRPDRLPDAESDDALRVLRRHGDTLWEARVLYNRGAARAELGDAARARRDLERAEALYAQLDLEAAVADARISLAKVRLLDGDPLGCFAELAAIEVAELSGWAACWFWLTRAEAHVAVRLLPEARADLRRFAESAGRAASDDSVRKGRLEAARLALLAGDADASAALAETARRSFSALGQAAFAAAATLERLAAGVAAGSAGPGSVRAGLRAAHVLARSGWTVEELRGRLLVARAAVDAGMSTTARRELAAARRLERRGTVVDRIGIRHVDALLRLESGDALGAERTLAAGLRLLEEHRTTLGSAEVRAAASALGVDAARTGLRLALEDGDPARVLRWAERLRANTLRLPPVRSPSHPELRAAQAELRAVGLRLREADDRGAGIPGLAARRLELEAAIREHVRAVRGDGAGPASIVDVRAAAVTLGSRVLVEYVELDGALRALTLARGRLRLHELGSGEVGPELEWLRFALGRLARRSATPTQRAAARATAGAAAAALDRLLVEPLAEEVGTGPLVVVPTGELHALPWSALPSLHGRPLVVAPSLAVWLELALRPGRRRRRTALVAGPGLRHAARETRALADVYPAATRLRGTGASVAATLAALDGAGLAHLACHGRFRSDSPLFSSLELADGPLSALDLQQLRRAPDVLVLSACDAALSDLRPGDELLGLSAALLGLGTRTIVASVAPVPDAAARRLMLAFHRALAAGAAPAAALAAAQAGLRGDSTPLAGFVCLGSG